jgi:hypothetical protein
MKSHIDTKEHKRSNLTDKMSKPTSSIKRSIKPVGQTKMIRRDNENVLQPSYRTDLHQPQQPQHRSDITRAPKPPPRTTYIESQSDPTDLITQSPKYAQSDRAFSRSTPTDRTASRHATADREALRPTSVDREASRPTSVDREASRPTSVDREASRPALADRDTSRHVQYKMDAESEEINRNLSNLMAKYAPVEQDVDENESWVEAEEIPSENEADFVDEDNMEIEYQAVDPAQGRGNYVDKTSRNSYIASLRERVDILNESISDMTHILGELVSAQKDLTNAIKKLTDDMGEL